MMISIRIGHDEDDAALLTRSLADLSWLRPRLADFLKLAPGLGIEWDEDLRVELDESRTITVSWHDDRVGARTVRMPQATVVRS